MTLGFYLQEAQIMMALDHHCVVQFIGECHKIILTWKYCTLVANMISGISKGPPVLVVLELVPLGSLLDFITDHSESVRPEMEIPLWVSTF